MLRVGLEELVRTEEIFIEQALRLIHDDGWRANVGLRLQSIDLDTTLFSTTHAPIPFAERSSI